MIPFPNVLDSHNLITFQLVVLHSSPNISNHSKISDKNIDDEKEFNKKFICGIGKNYIPFKKGHKKRVAYIKNETFIKFFNKNVYLTSFELFEITFLLK